MSFAQKGCFFFPASSRAEFARPAPGRPARRRPACRAPCVEPASRHSSPSPRRLGRTTLPKIVWAVPLAPPQARENLARRVPADGSHPVKRRKHARHAISACLPRLRSNVRIAPAEVMPTSAGCLNAKRADQAFTWKRRGAEIATTARMTAWRVSRDNGPFHPVDRAVIVPRAPFVRKRP